MEAAARSEPRRPFAAPSIALQERSPAQTFAIVSGSGCGAASGAFGVSRGTTRADLDLFGSLGLTVRSSISAGFFPCLAEPAGSSANAAAIRPERMTSIAQHVFFMVESL